MYCTTPTGQGLMSAVSGAFGGEQGLASLCFGSDLTLYRLLLDAFFPFYTSSAFRYCVRYCSKPPRNGGSLIHAQVTPTKCKTEITALEAVRSWFYLLASRTVSRGSGLPLYIAQILGGALESLLMFVLVIYLPQSSSKELSRPLSERTKAYQARRHVMHS